MGENIKPPYIENDLQPGKDDIEIVEKLFQPREGWMPIGEHSGNSEEDIEGIASYLKKTRKWVRKKIEQTLNDHPEWQPIEYKLHGKRGKVLFYPPELVAELKNLAEQKSDRPEGWMHVGGGYKSDDHERETKYTTGISGEIQKSPEWIQHKISKLLREHPEWKPEKYSLGKGRLVDFYPPGIILELKGLAERESPPPVGWMTIGGNTHTGETKAGIVLNVERNRDWIINKISQLLVEHPEWAPKEFLDRKNKLASHYPPELIEELKRIVSTETLIPDGWVTTGNTEEDSGSITGLVQRGRSWVEARIAALQDAGHLQNPFVYTKDSVSYYPPQVVAELKKIADAEEAPPEGWMIVGSKQGQGILSYLRRSHGWIIKKIDKILEDHHDWASRTYTNRKRVSLEYYPPQVVAELKKIADAEEAPPEGWMLVGTYRPVKGEKNSGIASIIKKSPETTRRLADLLLNEHPEWQPRDYADRYNRLTPHYPPELIEELKRRIDLENEGDIIGEIENEDKENVRKFIKEIAEDKTELAKHLRSLIQVFGASRCVDLLFRFRPDFKGLGVEYVKSLLAEYLGDFLAIKGGFILEGVKIPKGYLSDITLRQGFFETIKDNCLRYYFAQYREGRHADPVEIIERYIDVITENLGVVRDKEIDDVIFEVVQYYHSALRDFHKPDQFVDIVSEDREFPDMNQKINMKELADKKRLLIADEMGLGKSASVIMAKEHMRIGCALIAAPANVIETWKRYLSAVDKGGYFRDSAEPRVLEVTNPEQLKGVKDGQYDYILLSHGRLDERYVKGFADLKFDMLIVDEVHLLKKLKEERGNKKGESADGTVQDEEKKSGKRSEQLLALADMVHGENQYLALLSGTPVPNKVEDLALTLKLLHPEKFRRVSNRELVQKIIRGDIVDLRALLLPNMQMKSLEESVEIPRLTQFLEMVDLNEEEKDLYRVIVEDDELTSMDKIGLLRQTVLNPRVADVTPDIKGSKAAILGEKINAAFAEKSRVVVFVNDYVKGIIRGDKTIMDHFNLPPDVKVRIIHGEGVSTKDRTRFQDEFNAKSNEKILLIVSGKTADVGVNFTGAEEIFFYNEPWTEYQKRQETSRVHRFGLDHEVGASTLIARGTIEEGMHEYIASKFKAIEKLLRGIPLSELDKKLLTADENNPGNLENNQELAEYFLSSMQKLRKMFGQAFQIGEEGMARFVAEFGQEYAQGYADMGHRNYQANVNRMVGTIIDRFVSSQKLTSHDVRILDLASGPEMLKRHIPDVFQRRVVSMDINPHHFNDPTSSAVVGGMATVPFWDKSFEYVTSTLAWQDTTFIPGQRDFERIKMLHEVNRILKPNGRLVITLMYNLELRDVDKFAEAVEKLGFRVVSDHTGTAEESEHFAAQVITLEKIADCDPDLNVIVEQIGTQGMSGFKFDSTDTAIRNSKKIITNFTLNKEIVDVELNAEDQKLKRLEDIYIANGNLLKSKFDGIENIPENELNRYGFVRYKRKDSYALFKKMPAQSGYIIIH